MKNYIIINEFLNSNAFNIIYTELKNAFFSLGADCELLTNVQAIKLLKTNGRGYSVLFFDKDLFLATQLEKCGYRCVNSAKVIETCDDKAKTYLALLGKVRMPKTILAPFTFNTIGYKNYDFLVDIENELGYPMIVKQNKGSFGEQVYLVKDREQTIETLKKIGHSEVLFQEYITSSFGKDYRVYVVGGKVVASALRCNERDFRSNVASGGKMIKTSLPNEYEELAIKACEILGADFAGVDLLIGVDGPLICEINSNAHFSALSKVTGINVAKAIAEYVLGLK